MIESLAVLGFLWLVSLLYQAVRQRQRPRPKIPYGFGWVGQRSPDKDKILSRITIIRQQIPQNANPNPKRRKWD